MQESLISKIAQALVEARVLSTKELKKAVNDQQQQPDREIEEVLVESGRIKREDYLAAASRVTGVESIDLRTWKLHYSTAQIVPQSMAQRFNILCVGKQHGRIVIAMVDPHDSFAIEYVKMRTGFDVSPRCAYVGDLKRAMADAYSVAVTRIDAETPTKAPEEERQEKGRFVVATRDRRASDQIIRNTIRAGPGTGKTISLRGYPMGSLAMVSSEAGEAEALRLLLEVGSELASTLDADSLIHKILVISMELLDTEACSLILIGEELNTLYFRAAVGAGSEQVRSMSFPLDEHSLAGYSIQNRKSLVINDVTRDPRHNRDVDDAVQYRTRSVLCVPVLWRGEPLGVIEAVNKREGAQFSDRDQAYLEILASQAAVAIHNSQVMSRLQNFYHEAVEIVIDLLECNQHINRNHLVEVARFCTAMGNYLQLSAPEMERLCYAALLHDLGKVRCQDPDDPEHAEIGGQILSQVKLFRDIAPLVRHHHEHYDGTGLPDGLRGGQMPRLVGILAVAEAWVEGLEKAGRAEWRRVLGQVRDGFRTRYDPNLRQAFEYAVETSGIGRA